MSASVELRPMTDEQFAAFCESTVEGYAQEIEASGLLPAAEAREKALRDQATFLPQGHRTPDHYLWIAYDGDAEVGWLWLGVKERSNGLHAFIYDIAVREESRRKGYGAAIIEAAEAVCRERGAVEIGLNVFGFNHAARGLYEKVGFEVAAVQMRKRL
ncbi:GNAT family N-acetyltransferase [Rhizomonospora bruguierae]|uniref:GNAT family N-acetyltransferase n=1 Tax=Rhizomonospora bruguierae TaxID=1581705 RepID=UPI001BCDED0C|nr:GNAT family N-acetyltransferase [Micromonospora sp. NBRC 107566]